MTLKRIQVIMLPTKEKATIIKSNDTKFLTIVENWSGKHLGQHLSFLSDEEIKEGDWVYRFNSKDIFKADSFLIHLIEKGSTENCKKIIASTDSSLIIYDESKYIKNSPTVLSLPQPSQDFIKVFVEEYNKGNVIKWVDVEYEEYFHSPSPIGMSVDERLKVNSKNEITIRKIKDSYTREEVIELLHKRMTYTFGEDYDKSTTDKWISENL